MSEHGPPSIDVMADDPRASLASRTQVLIGVTAAGWWFYALRAVIQRDWSFIGVTGGAAVLTSIVFAVHRAKQAWTRPLAHANVTIATLFIVLVCAISEQSHSPALTYLVCVPLCMGYLHGIRTAAMWAAICAVVVFLLHVFTVTWPLPALHPITVGERTISAIVLIGIAVGLLTGGERLHAAHLAALARREDKIQELNRGLQKKTLEAEEARDQAMAASRAKGEFVATLSHEIRTPLFGVLGMASLLLDGELPASQRELVRTIRTSGDALLSLLNDMLDFSKIEAGKLELEGAAFDVRDCVEDTFDLVGVAAAAKKLRLAYLVAPGTATRVVGDSARVRQILVNLVGNAVKFTDEGEIVVEIERATSEKTGRHALLLSVRDTGPGIPPDRLEKIFEPFTQADASTTRRVGGTGLGLTICRRLAEAMGGRAWAQSERGAGATFRVLLELGVAPPTVTQLSGDAPPTRVIVATPHIPTARMLSAALEAVGALVARCSTAGELAREITGGHADLLIAESTLAAQVLPGDGRGVPGEKAPARVTLLLPWEIPPESAPVLRAPVRRAEVSALLSRVWGRAAHVPRLTPLPQAYPPKGMNVLVAEDNPVNQRVVRLMLERLGCRTEVVENGVQVLEAVRARPFDLVMMDVRMPEMDGITATRALCAEIAPDRRPMIVAMTANVTTEDRRECQAAGMDDFIPKPIRPNELSRVVEQAQRRSAPPPPPLSA